MNDDVDMPGQSDGDGGEMRGSCSSSLGDIVFGTSLGYSLKCLQNIVQSSVPADV